MVEIPVGIKLRPIVIEQRDTTYTNMSWWSTNPTMATHGIMIFGDMWKEESTPWEQPRRTESLLEDAKRVMEEVHEGVCGPHMNGIMLAKKILRQGYFWSTMETECVEYVRRCRKCQIHANLAQKESVKTKANLTPELRHDLIPSPGGYVGSLTPRPGHNLSK
ncbi:hypothetical protein RHMOL_Rhmol02G0191600 [Rhododendron molle]|uniref:Uncharacterized protein n=1 Tax=Rhododendron molle TaxID=49168 RepID=A0ACC0PRM8_RHOML|nr:hypothetical protein RHMOL_Rhmol02G0191600 [Rhododendron molle]